MRIRRAVILVIPLLLATPTMSVMHQAPRNGPPAMIGPELRASLEKLDKDTARWAQKLKTYDTGFLRVEYREGKLIEGSLNLCDRSLKSLQESIQTVSRTQSLTSSINLLLDILNLHHNFSSLSHQFSDIVTPLDEATREKGLSWARELLDFQKELLTYRIQVRQHVLSYARVADILLMVDSLREELDRGTRALP